MSLEKINAEILDVQTEIEQIKSNVNIVIQIANDKGLPGKIAEVVQDFGKWSDYGGGDTNYISKTIHIYMGNRSYIRVKVDGYSVFECTLYENGKGDIDLYKPGPWEIEIETLHKQIPVRKLKIRLQAYQNDLYRLKKKWGLE